MDINEGWIKALKNTEIIRGRVQSLKTFSETTVPYILLSESGINFGDTVVRKGEVVVEKPSLILPPNIPQLEGFDFENEGLKDDAPITNFLYFRGVSLPSLKYNNKTNSLDVFEGKLSAAIKHYLKELQEQENVFAGLIAGPEDAWQFSVLIFICSQISRDIEIDVKKLLEEYKRKKN